ncbi:MAG TPA: hypothetical protein VFF77_04150 [Holophagaceae bacterium]|nr:hypothetical protein [Holophagaceae bacterium]
MDWVWGFGFAWISLAGAAAFVWVGRHDPVFEGQIDPVSSGLAVGCGMVWAWLLLLSWRDWRAARVRLAGPVIESALATEGYRCAACGAIWILSNSPVRTSDARR